MISLRIGIKKNTKTEMLQDPVTYSSRKLMISLRSIRKMHP